MASATELERRHADARHIGKRHQPAVGIRACRHASGQAVAHAVMGGGGTDHRQPSASISPASSSCSGRSTAMLWARGLQRAGGGHRHRRTVGQRLAQLVGPEAPPLTGRQQQADDARHRLT